MTYRKLALALAVTALAPFASAQLLYTNIGSATTFTPGSGYTIGTSGSNFEQAQQFTVSQNGYLDFAEIALWGAISGTPSVNIAVMSDAAGSPGSVIETINFGLAAFAGGSQPLAHAEFSNLTYLTTGTTYWFAISPGADSTWTAWEVNGSSGTRTFDSGNIGFTDAWGASVDGTLGGLKIYGAEGAAAVPEPSTYGLIGVVALGLLGVLRRRTTRA